MSVYHDNPNVVRPFVTITSDDSAGRMSRAAQIRAERKRYESAHGVRLEFSSVTYCETHGFLSRTAIRYRIA